MAKDLYDDSYEEYDEYEDYGNDPERNPPITENELIQNKDHKVHPQCRAHEA